MPTFTPPLLTNINNLLWKLNQSEIQGSPIQVFPGDARTLTITVEGSNAPSSPGATIYKGRTDVTSTVFPSGSLSVSGQVITLKPIATNTLVAGSDYSLMINATIAGNVEYKRLVIQVLDPKQV